MAVILIVEDEKNTNEAICEYLKSIGHNAVPAYNGAEALRLFKESSTDLSIDLIVLDIMLPQLSGISLLHEIRKVKSTPVIMLTALSDEYTQVRSFDELADDYMTKPFSMVILGKRIAALLRRKGQIAQSNKAAFGEIIVDFSGYSAYYKDNKNIKIDITPKEIDLLRLFVENKGLVLTRSQILDELWGYDYPIIDRTVDTYIKNLRKKLGADCIVTVKGIGYKYEGA